MTKDEKISLLTDNTLYDKDVAKILGVSIKYIPILRRRWKLKSKVRGNKVNSIKSNTIIFPCKICGISIRSSKRKRYCSRKCQYTCPEYRLKLKMMNKSYMQTEEYRNTLIKDTTPAYKKYYNRVKKLTEQVYNDNIDIINPGRLPRTICGVKGGYQLDHIIPVKFGFDNNLPAEEIAQLKNLRIISWEENLQKGSKIKKVEM